MRIGNQEFDRVAVLVLDYDPYREGRPSEAVVKMYGSLCRHLQETYPVPSRIGQDVVVLANEELVARHQKDFEQSGLTFFPNWRDTQEYRELLREGLRQGQIYLMKDIGHKGGVGSWFTPEYTLRQVTEEALEIVDPENMINIRPKHPAYS